MTINPFEALRHAFFSVFRNMGAAFGISWPWLIVLGLAIAGLSVFQFQNLPDAGAPPDAVSGQVVALILLFGLLYLLAFSSIAVNWHRYILLDEVPRGAQRLRVDGHVASYVWRLFVAALATIAVIVLPMLIAGAVLGNFTELAGEIDFQNGTWRANLAKLALQGVLTAFAGAVFFRSALALPAAALGRYEIGIGESWRRTQGNFVALMIVAAGSWLLQVAVQLVMLGATTLAAAADSAVGLSALVAVSVALTWYVTFFGITLFTSLYGFFVEKRQL